MVYVIGIKIANCGTFPARISSLARSLAREIERERDTLGRVVFAPNRSATSFMRLRNFQILVHFIYGLTNTAKVTATAAAYQH